MIHFLYLLGFAFFVGIGFGALTAGTTRERVLYGVKAFAQFLIISLALAWLFYFIPW